MPLPALRGRKPQQPVLSNCAESEISFNKESEFSSPSSMLRRRAHDPDERRPVQMTTQEDGVEDSPLNESLLMLVDLAHDIQVCKIHICNSLETFLA